MALELNNPCRLICHKPKKLRQTKPFRPLIVKVFVVDPLFSVKRFTGIGKATLALRMYLSLFLYSYDLFVTGKI